MTNVATSPTPTTDKPALETVDLWPLTSLQHYITGISALNIPDPAGTGDWHFVETFEGFAGRKPGRLQVAGIDLTDTAAYFGEDGVFDARERLEARRLTPPPGPVWAADHTRALADMLLHDLAQGWDFETLIHLDDWLCRPEEQVQFAAFLQPVRRQIADAQWERIARWLVKSRMDCYR